VVHVGQAFATPVSGHFADKMPASLAVGGGIWYLSLCFGLTAAMQSEWQLWFVYGVMSGVAYGALNLNVFSAAVTRAMPPSSRGVAIGIATSGSTVGQLLLLPTFAQLCASFGWRAGYISLCCCSVLLGLAAALVLRERPRCGSSASSSSEGADIAIAAPRQEADADHECHDEPRASEAPLISKLRAMWKSRAFWLLTVAFFMCGVTTTGFMETHIVAIAVSRGMDRQTGALAFSLLSACNGGGMVLAGYLTDRYSRPAILASIFGIRALAYLLLLAATSPSALFFFAIIFGIVDYSVVPPTVSLVGTHLGEHCVGLAVGVLLMWHSLAASVGAVLGGAIFDASGSYRPAMLVCAAVCAVGAASCLLLASTEPLVRVGNQAPASSSTKALQMASADVE